MYKALYRKWRPRVFEDVIGQPHVTTTLKNEIAAGRIAHAYIFTGSRGTGKTTCAKILAKAVNCLNPKDGGPCNACENCKGIDDGSAMDIVEIDAASNNGVDNIRSLREEAGYTPAKAKFRVYIIDEAHMLSIGAFNALLKTLEEPPAYVIFVLATTEVHKIPVTILSRCQRFDFRRIPSGDISARLLQIAQAEGIALDDDAAFTIARVSDGGMRDALSLLDQCAGAGRRVDEALVMEAAGLTSREYLFKLSSAVARRDAGAALTIIGGLYDGSKDMDRLCEELIAHFRNILVAGTVRDFTGLVEGGNEYIASLKEAAGGIRPETALHAIETLEETQEALKKSASRRVLMESCFLRLCSPEIDTSKTALLDRISSLEKKLRYGTAGASYSPSPPAGETGRLKELPPGLTETTDDETPSVRAAAEVPVPEEAADTPDEPFTKWNEVIQLLKETAAPLYGFLEKSEAVVRGGHLLIDTKSGVFPGILKQTEQRKKLVEAIKNVSGRQYKIGILKTVANFRASDQNDPLDELAGSAKKLNIPLDQK